MTEKDSQKVRVLLAEDNFLIALQIQLELQAQGYEVVGPVPSSEQGVTLANEGNVDVGILDASLHDGDSGPIAAALHARNCPFLFVTGYQQPPLSDGRWNEIEVIRKPIDFVLLDRVLRQLLEAPR